jgi:hypothetical protein
MQHYQAIALQTEEEAEAAAEEEPGLPAEPGLDEAALSDLLSLALQKK